MVFAMATGFNSAVASSTDKNEKEFQALLEELNNVSETAYMEAHGLNQNNKIYIFEIDGTLRLESDASDLHPEEYKILFQSDLLMESNGNQYYIIGTEGGDRKTIKEKNNL